MKYISRLWRVELSAIAALLICAVIMSTLGYIDNLSATASGKNHIFTPASSAWLHFSYTIMIGILPIILFGAPLYALICKKKKWLITTTASIGITPGLAILIFSKEDLAFIALLCGLVISILTHYIYSHFAVSKKSSNKSFKPTPKSGAV